MVGAIEKRLRELLMERAGKIDITIENMEVLPDHVHLFVKSSPVNGPHYIVRQLKGFSSRILRLEFPSLLKMPSLWTRSYYCESVGHISELTIKRYIEDQKR